MANIWNIRMGGGYSQDTYNSLNISDKNIVQYRMSAVGMRSALRSNVYGSADEAYAVATAMPAKYRLGPTEGGGNGGGGALEEGDGDGRPGFVMPMGDVSWWLLMMMGGLYGVWKRGRKKCNT